MMKFMLSKSLDTQLKEQRFGLLKVGDFETILETMRNPMFPKWIEEAEWYVAPFRVVGLKENDFEGLEGLEGKSYALYARHKKYI